MEEKKGQKGNEKFDEKIFAHDRFKEPTGDLPSLVSQSIQQATEYLFSAQRKGFYWCAELESNSAMTAEYVFLCQVLDAEDHTHWTEQSAQMIRYFSQQQKSDGGWSVSGADQTFGSDLSITVETYLALRILGVTENSSLLMAAQKFILTSGGLKKVKVTTRIFLAIFGLMPWETIPSLPAELIFLASRFPVNIYHFASWIRGSVVPLFVIFHYRPVYALPNGRAEENNWLDHLWVDRQEKKVPYISPLFEQILGKKLGWKTVLSIADPWLKKYDRFSVKKIRERALQKCTEWILERQESSGDWANICPTLINYLIALSLRGFLPNSDPITKGMRAIRELGWEDSQGYRIQAGVSPVWDTAFSILAVVESNLKYDEERVQRATQWIVDRQLLVDYGDWKITRPHSPAGGWSTEYFNSWYPNVDCTAVVVLALLKQNAHYNDTVDLAVRWILAMQNRDGGWAAFDADNDRILVHPITYEFKILCDLSTPDVTGRVLEALSLARRVIEKEKTAYGLAEITPQFMEELRRACQSAAEFLKKSQESEGSWFGRWGVNYIYGTSLALGGWAGHLRSAHQETPVVSAIQWLRRVQNPDGGWGEGVQSYKNRHLMGKGTSTPSQTAWALMGLMHFVPPQDPAVERGIRWLLTHQKGHAMEAAYEGGHLIPKLRGMTWEESESTGTRFPKHSYLRYHYYRHYFPMMALGRYLKLRTS